MDSSARLDVDRSTTDAEVEEVSSCEDEFDDGGSFFWDADNDEQHAGVAAASSASHASGSSTAERSAELAQFRMAWMDWGLEQQELERHFHLSGKRVRELRAECRRLGVAPPASSTHGGRAAPELPSREELENRCRRGDLVLKPVASGLDTLATELGVSVHQLSRHLRKIDFSPKHPVPKGEVRAALDALLSRPWCNRLGPNFAHTELRRIHGWDVRPALVKELLAELDPTGSRRHLKTYKRRKRPQYNVKAPRSLYHADGHEKLAHRWGFWIHGCVDGYARFSVYLQARTNKKQRIVRDIYVTGCEKNGWPSRCRWDKGTENRGAIREQINRHLDPLRPETGRRGSAITGRSIDNTRIEGFWRYVREQVSDPFGDCFNYMRTELKILHPDDPCDLFMLHEVFLPILQTALDDMRDMWNEHPIRRRSGVPGHFGGIPSQLFREGPDSGALRLRDDEEFYRTRGTLREGVDEDGQYGVEAARAVPEQPECEHEGLPTLDPLLAYAPLQAVRQAYLAQNPLQTGGSFGRGRLEAFTPFIQEYLRFKSVCGELLVAYLEFWDSDSCAVDWMAFGSSASCDSYAESIRMRTTLAAIAVAVTT